jgi:hypothetical protein
MWRGVTLHISKGGVTLHISKGEESLRYDVERSHSSHLCGDTLYI